MARAVELIKNVGKVRERIYFPPDDDDRERSLERIKNNINFYCDHLVSRLTESAFSV
jgi:hypothetical protein